MSAQPYDNIEVETCESANGQDPSNDSTPRSKLEIRRRIEDLYAERRMREDLGEFDLI
jgi:CRISPR/Cas system type I-B associated protein Csh2 (Cas7 group RAMP superfamily)